MKGVWQVASVASTRRDFPQRFRAADDQPRGVQPCGLGVGGGDPQRDGVSDATAYAQAALQGEAQRVRVAVIGGRNHALNKAAYNLGRLAGAGALTYDHAYNALWHAASGHFGPLHHDMSPTKPTPPSPPACLFSGRTRRLRTPSGATPATRGRNGDSSGAVRTAHRSERVTTGKPGRLSYELAGSKRTPTDCTTRGTPQGRCSESRA